ncbi:MAG: hypothetical protein JXR19_09200 [Bacteroidia bacterium]
MSLIDRLNHIENKLKSLQNERNQLQHDNLELEKRIGELEAKLENSNAAILNLEEQNKIIKLAGGLSSNQDNEAVRQQIDDLIKEVDHCIKLVKR